MAHRLRQHRPSFQFQDSDQVRHAKVVLLGNAWVGKSSITMRFHRNQFFERKDHTIGAAYVSKTTTVADKTVHLSIWDTGGEERYKALVPMFYRDANAAVIVYDVTEEKTLYDALRWAEDLRSRESRTILVYLVGNKVDLAADKRAITTEDGEEMAADNEMLFAEVSAKTGEGIKEMFDDIALALVNMEAGHTRPQPMLLPRMVRLPRDVDKKSGSSHCPC